MIFPRGSLPKLTLVLVLYLLNFSLTFSAGESCGGILEGESGLFSSLTPSIMESESPQENPCFWIIRTVRSSRVLFKGESLKEGSAFFLYPEHNPADTFLQPIIVTASNLSSTVETQGQILIVVLVQSENGNEPFSFSWDSHDDLDDEAADGIFHSASYIDSSQGQMTRKKLTYPQKTVLALNSVESTLTEPERSNRRMSIEGEVKFTGCDLIDPCECSYYGLYEILPSGYLREVHRVCGRPLSFSAVDLSPSLVQFLRIGKGLAHLNPDEVNESSVNVSWSIQDGDENPNPTTTTTTTESTTTVKPQPFVCPPPDEIAPFECHSQGYSRIGSSYSYLVNQTLIDRIFPALAAANNNSEQSSIYLDLFQLERTNITQLNMTCFVNANVTYDVFAVSESNNALEKITGPDLNVTGSERRIVANSITMDFTSLTNQGLSDFLGYFDQGARRLQFYENDKLTGGRFPLLDGSGDVEFLPRLASFTNLEELTLGGANLSYIGGGQFKRNRNLRLLSIHCHNCTIDDGAFLLDLPDVQVPADEVLQIDLYTMAIFNGSSTTFLTRRPTTVVFWQGSVDSIPQRVFEPFLLAHENNNLDFSRTTIQCNSNMRWLKEQRKKFERKVFRKECKNDPGYTIFTSNLV